MEGLAGLLDSEPRSLLTEGNPKLLKGSKYGVDSVALHFAPADLSGSDVCKFRSVACTELCLNVSGHAMIGVASKLSVTEQLELMPERTRVIHIARIQRTRSFQRDPSSFMRRLIRDIDRAERKALKAGRKLAVRLNATSDRLWENIPVDGFRNIFERFPNVQFYDYTKVPVRLRRRALAIANYDLTFSRAENNAEHVQQAIDAGLNVAVVFSTPRGQPLPELWQGVRVIDGDESDLRFADPRGVIVGLRAKGRAIGDTSGFVVNVDGEAYELELKA